MSHEYSFGIEEEYFIVERPDRKTRKGAIKAFHDACSFRFEGRIQHEMLQTQIETATVPCTDFREARAYLGDLRRDLGTLSDEHDLFVFAAGTHPTALWPKQRATDGHRYDKLMRDLRMLGSRNLVCGLHVHVEVAHLEERVNLMNRITPFLPLLLALSTSSPFWQARWTGLLGYRLAAYRELPRTGLPEFFDGAADYDRYVAAMIAAGAISDSSFVWWAVRPSLRYPTLELRVTDSCTRLEDAICIAALYRCLLRCLDRRPDINANLTGATRAIATENTWRAQRYGIHGTFVDEAGPITVAEALEQVLALIAEDAAALDCVAEVEHARQIIAQGTSADHQLALFNDARGRGKSTAEALQEVVAWMAAVTTGRAMSPDGDGITRH